MSKKDNVCRSFYDDCEYESVPSVLHMLKSAMVGEKEMAKYYKYMAKISSCEADKKLFMEIREQELQHFCLLQEIYRDLTCECYCVEYVNVKHPKGFCKGIKKAICWEMEAVKMYDQLAHCMADVRHKEIICCIMNEEKEHAQALAGLYKLAQDCAAKRKCCSMPNFVDCGGACGNMASDECCNCRHE